MNYGGEEIEVTHPFICPLCGLRVRSPRDAPPARRGVPLPGVRLVLPSAFGMVGN